MPEIDIDELRRRVGTYAEPVDAAPASEHVAALGAKRGRAQGKVAKGADAAEPTLAGTTGLFEDDPARRAMLADCHRLLAAAQYTEHELARKLAAKEHDGEIVAWAIERCRAAGLVDDARYAARYVESRIGRGHGASRIRADLARRGVPRDLLDPLLAAAVETGELDAAATEAARRKAARLDLDDPKQRARVARHLAGRGFGPGQIDSAIRTVRGEPRT